LGLQLRKNVLKPKLQCKCFLNPYLVGLRRVSFWDLVNYVLRADKLFIDCILKKVLL